MFKSPIQYSAGIAGGVMILALAFPALTLSATAQDGKLTAPAAMARLDPITLPDAPSASLNRTESGEATPVVANDDAPSFVAVRLLSAPKYARVIEPEYQPQRLGSFGKAAYGMHEVFGYWFPVEVVISAGLSHGANNDPLYGKDRVAFAQRVGAAAARQASQSVFSDAIMAPILHQDPRYYVMGSDHSTFKRFGYAATRVLFTRTDSGQTTPNLSLLAGYAGSAALTQLYYPVASRSTAAILSGYGLSLGGRAIGYELAEFIRLFGGGQPRQRYGTFQ